MTSRFPSCRHACCPPKLDRRCHHSNACDGSAGVRLLVHLHVSFITYQNLLLLGFVRIVFLGLLASVIGGDHGALNLRSFPDRNRSTQKYDENSMQEPRGIRGVIYYELSKHKEGYDTKTRRSRSSGKAHPLQALGSWGPRLGWVWPPRPPIPPLFRLVTSLMY